MIPPEVGRGAPYTKDNGRACSGIFLSGIPKCQDSSAGCSLRCRFASDIFAQPTFLSKPYAEVHVGVPGGLFPWGFCQGGIYLGSGGFVLQPGCHAQPAHVVPVLCFNCFNCSRIVPVQAW